MSEGAHGQVVVTTSWDDGHVLDHKLAQLLDKHGLPGTFYVAPHNVELEPRDRLDDQGLRDLAARFEIGAHTLRHVRLPLLPDAVAAAEIRDGRAALEDALGVEVDTFCYVGGQYAPRHAAMVREQGFRLARTVERHRTDAGDPYELPTTMHTYRHWSDAAPIWRMAAGDPRTARRFYLGWDDLAIHLFEQVRREGGVFHLWGHSWELEARGEWSRLERVLAHVAHHPEVTYLPNSGLHPLPEHASRTDRAGADRPEAV